MSADTVQGIAALIGISLVATGTWREFGGGWSMIVVGSLLLAGVIYARTRTDELVVLDDLPPEAE